MERLDRLFPGLRNGRRIDNCCDGRLGKCQNDALRYYFRPSRHERKLFFPPLIRRRFVEDEQRRADTARDFDG